MTATGAVTRRLPPTDEQLAPRLGIRGSDLVRLIGQIRPGKPFQGDGCSAQVANRADRQDSSTGLL